LSGATVERLEDIRHDDRLALELPMVVGVT
jgi:hypothetical protein